MLKTVFINFLKLILVIVMISLTWPFDTPVTEAVSEADKLKLLALGLNIATFPILISLTHKIEWTMPSAFFLYGVLV